MLAFDLSVNYKGVGVSEGIDRGLLVYDGDTLLLEEGMGLGACSLQTGGYTYFASVKNIEKDGDSLAAVYIIDKRLEWTIWGLKSTSFTRILEYIATNMYMKHENTQSRLLKLGGHLKRLFKAETCFVSVPAQGVVRIAYEIGDHEISVDLSCETEKDGIRLFVMNELGGSIFDTSFINGESSASPTGWQKIVGQCELYSHNRSLAFTMAEINVPENVRSTPYWGRELIPDVCCWAGFESEIVCASNKFSNYRYTIKFREEAKYE
ncbi:hypothetical protein [Parasporobacterium paucivorans]|uniref:Uncharacterized protein n=1 Tax=Parasporobacterium paucivorans DSM 15970 TaxID=1122934 RepID=A0A1M6HC07_9FIRM|nr:hypothetical protein [Parasporobacterium paucivorans]SHJ19715.1 hypothetical protein SAMN02745691_01521 [Parasporobacterium paucivorans DSM 15970]